MRLVRLLRSFHSLLLFSSSSFRSKVVPTVSLSTASGLHFRQQPRYLQYQGGIMRKFLVSTSSSSAGAPAKVDPPKPPAPSAATPASASTSSSSTAPVASATAAPSAPTPVPAPSTAAPAASSASLATTYAPPVGLSTDALDASLASKTVRDFITWQPGESIPYSVVVNTFEEISKVGGRLDKENLMSKLFSAVLCTTPAELEAVVYLASNNVYPVYEGLELGIGDSLLVKAVCEATGRKKEAVEEAYDKEGDLGVVAVQSRTSQKTLGFAAKPKPLMASQVLEQFRQITQIKGDKAQARKVDIIKAMMIRCQGQEAKYIVRALQGKLRIGTAEQTVLVALAHSLIDLQRRNPNASNTTASFFDKKESSKKDKKSKKSKSAKSSKSVEKKTTKAVTVGSLDTDSETEDALVDSDVDEVSDREGEDSDGEDSESVVEREGEAVMEVEDTTTTAVPTATNSSPEDIVKDSYETIYSRVHAKETNEAIKLREHFGTGKRSYPREELYTLGEIAIKRAYSECPNLSLLLNAAVSHPLHEMYLQCKLKNGVPVAPMLAKPTKEINEVLKRLSGLAFTMEYKYDGERAQVHLLPDGSVKIFSRNSEDNTEKYPDLRDIILKAVNDNVTETTESGLTKRLVESCIIDAEVVAFDREKNCLLPFQVLSTRKRKVESGEEDNQKVKVVLQAFDLLYLNGKSLLRESLRTRRELLHKSFHTIDQQFYFASGMDHVENGDTLPIESFLLEACNSFCEGLMVKTLDDNATYEPSKRSLNWLKLKKDYINGMGVCDSVDLVPIGGYFGKGKRTNVYGAYLMACYDPERDEYQSVCKVGTGFKDDDLIRLTDLMKQHVIISNKKPINYNVGEPLYPDEWFESGKIVWEIQAADLSRSSVHRGGVGRVDNNVSRGIGLRFPRYLRDRDDKKAELATTSEQIVEMFYNQSSGTTEEVPGSDNEDFI